uniref:Uncharacterized protein n=1 Tax=Parascaris equorum TaxID=6256 RepID=A0A914S298_PAREQ
MNYCRIANSLLINIRSTTHETCIHSHCSEKEDDISECRT